MTKKVNRRPTFLAHCLALLALLALAGVTAAAQCASPLFAAGQNVNVGDRVDDIASGDLNRDGLTDFVVADSYRSVYVSLIFGSPAGTLAVKKLNVGSPQTRVALGDFNNDGKLDLVTLHSTSVAVRLGNGLGAFGAAYTASLGFGRSTAVVPADFNNDGKLDLFIADGNYGSSRLLLGNGGGGLGAPTLLSSFKGADSAAAGDFNNDGKVDLAVEVAFDDPIYIYLGDGAGQFGAPKSISADNTVLVKTADFDKDGDLDLLTVLGSTIYVRLGDGAAGFDAPGTFDAGFKLATIAVADVNGDGKLDLVPAGSRSVGVLLGAGTGGFGPAAVYKLSGNQSAVAVGDFNGDGKADVVTGNNPGMQPMTGTIPATLSLLLGAGAGKLSHPAVLNGSQTTVGVAAGDLNGDGRADLVIVNHENNVAVLRGNGAGGFGVPTFYAVDDVPTSVALGDLTGDGRLDIVTTNAYNGTVSALVNTGTSFRPHVDANLVWSAPVQAGIGDFNSDGKADLAVVYEGNDRVAVLLGDGKGGFGPVTNYTIPDGGYSVVVNDFNSDGKADIAIGLVNGFAVLRGDGAGGFGAASIINISGLVYSLAVADFNGDGKADIAGASTSLGTVSIFLGNGLGGFTRQPSLALNPGLFAVTAADYDGDGKPDLTTAQTDGTTSLYLGKGTGGFTPPVTFITGGASARKLFAADFNGDGRPDLAVANMPDLPPSQLAPAGATVLLNRCSAPPAPALPSLSVSDVEVTEGDGATTSATFTVNLSAAATWPVTVSFYPAGQDASSGTDFKAVSGRLTFAPGETTKTIVIPVIGDALDEADESFDLILAHPLNAQVSKGRGHAKIFDNDLPPAVSANNLSQAEGNSGSSSVVFAVTLSQPSGKTVTVKYATADATATAPSDYTARALTTLTFAPGEITKDVIVAVRGDIYDEADETFKLVLSSPTNATLAAAGTCTIKDDDPPPAITINNATVTEPDTGTLAATFTVKLSVASRQTVTVKYATANGTSNPAAAGTDYTAVALTTLTFLPGEITKTVTVQVRGDLLKELNETFFVNLSAPVNATLADAQGLGAITNDD